MSNNQNTGVKSMAGGSGSGRAIDALSLWCALCLVCGLCGFALLIVVAKPALSAVMFGDVSAYLLLIGALAAGIWGLTWFYMARLPLDGDNAAGAAGRP